jgi:hypothetical protein
MAGDWEQRAIEVMNTVMDHPGALLFMIPPVIGDDFPEDYFQVVPHPMDFMTIRSCLYHHKYNTPDDWLWAVDLVFQNTRRYYRDGSIVDLATYVHDIFQRAYDKTFQLSTTVGWCGEVLRLRDKIGRLNAAPPAVLMKPVTLGRKVVSQLLTLKELKLFLAAMAKITRTEDHERLLRLIRDEEPGLAIGEGMIQLNVMALKPATIKAVRDFVKARLEEQGIPYPTTA